MSNFINDNFLLENNFAIKLYHEYAINLPIIDYHCHLSPKDICNNRKFKNISENEKLTNFTTRNPLVVNENMPAQKALAIMNEKQITSLLIIADKDLKKTISKFRDDELEHHDIGIEHDAESAPGYKIMSKVIELGCKTAIAISKKI